MDKTERKMTKIARELNKLTDVYKRQVRWEVYDTLKALAVSEVWIMKKE